MPEEVELKLALGTDGAAHLPRHPALANRPAHRETLTNTYYDTPDGALETARVALRLRRTPERTLQTLKTAGEGSGGLSSRGEWEWEVGDAGLDLAGLAALPPMQALGEQALAALEPRFTTDFVRHSWVLEVADATLEVALDQGEIRAGTRRVAIDELELELKSADDPTALWQLASQFAEQVPLRPANASKAARGSALAAGGWSIAAASGLPQARFDHAILLLDALTDTQDASLRQRARDTLQSLADDTTLSEAARAHAGALVAALARPDWLTTAFGRHSLGLQAALHPR